MVKRVIKVSQHPLHPSNLPTCIRALKVASDAFVLRGGSSLQQSVAAGKVLVDGHGTDADRRGHPPNGDSCAVSRRVEQFQGRGTYSCPCVLIHQVYMVH